MADKELTRERTTFSIDVDVKDNLEDRWLWLRRKLKGQAVTKSAIVEKAIKMALEDLNNNKETSKLYKKLDKN